MKKVREAKSMRGSLNSSMGEPLMANNKLAYSGHQELPIAPDGISSGTPATREALSDPDSLRALWFSKYPCNPPARHASKARRVGAFGEAKPVPEIYFSASSALSAVKCKKVQPMLRKAILFIGLAVLVACASDLPSVKTLAQHQASNPSADISDASYLIGPGDVLSIDVWREPELSKQVSVRLDGKISLPLVNDIQTGGLTSTELRNQLTEKYRNFVEVPEVSVSVIESRSKKIYLLGKVTRPGEYVLQKNMTIVQAISLAGGLAEWADAEEMKLIRKIKGTEKTFRVDYDAIVSGEDLSQNVLLQPDDTIFVP